MRMALNRWYPISTQAIPAVRLGILFAVNCHIRTTLSDSLKSLILSEQPLPPSPPAFWECGKEVGRELVWPARIVPKTLRP